MPICTLMLICGCQCLRLIPGFTVQPSRILLLSTYKAAMWISTLWSADGRWEKIYDRILIFTAYLVSALKTSYVMCKDRSNLASILKKRVLQQECNDIFKTLGFSKYSDDKIHVASAFCTIPTVIQRFHDKYLRKVFEKVVRWPYSLLQPKTKRFRWFKAIYYTKRNRKKSLCKDVSSALWKVFNVCTFQIAM